MTRDLLLTVDEAALLVDVSARTVRRWIAAGLLSAEPNALRAKAKLYRARAVFEAERAARMDRVDGHTDRVS